MPLLSATGIDKRFGGVVALDGADFSCEAGEIHALLGENGAGKSTMVKVLCGVHPPDAGTITYDGEPVTFRGPSDAVAVGIVPVFQELSLVPDLTVAENLFMGEEPRTRLGLVDGKRMRREAGALLVGARLPGIDPGAVVRDLSLADRQLVEIAKAMRRAAEGADPRRGDLGAQPARGGAGLRRRAPPLRRGRRRSSSSPTAWTRCANSATGPRSSATASTSAPSTWPRPAMTRSCSMMIGRTLRETFPAADAAARRRGTAAGGARSRAGATACAISRWSSTEGEILGLSGLEGQGQGDLLFALFGVYAGVSGEVSLGGKPIRLGGPRDAMTAGLALVPEDRKTQGLILPLPVDENITLPTLPEVSRSGVISPAAVEAATRSMRDRLAIRMASPADAGPLPQRRQPAESRHRQVAADRRRRLSPVRSDPRHRRRREAGDLRADARLASEGHGILFFSTDLAEIVGLCDRALVMYEGAVVRELRGAALTEANLVSAAVGLAEAVSERVSESQEVDACRAGEGGTRG